MANIIEAKDRNGRVVLDMTVSADTTVNVDQLNGHQGDDGRVIPFVVVHGKNHLPFNMQGKSLDLVGTDAQGRVKISGSTFKTIDPAAGTLDFTVPGSFYQAVGDYTNAYFRVKDSDGTVISTVNVKFTVLEGADYLTLGDSKIYNGYVDQSMAGIQQKVATGIASIQSLLSGTQGSADVARSAVQAMMQAISSNQVATFGGENNFTGTNKFHGYTEIDNLHGPALDSIYDTVDKKVSGLNSNISSVTSKLGNVLRTDAFWNRDYTFGGALSRANNGNDFALSKFHIMDNVNIIMGRGDVHVNMNNKQYAEADIWLPWVVDNADVAFAQAYYKEGYAIPRLNAKDKHMFIEYAGVRDDIERLTLLIIAGDH